MHLYMVNGENVFIVHSANEMKTLYLVFSATYIVVLKTSLTAFNI